MDTYPKWAEECMAKKSNKCVISTNSISLMNELLVYAIISILEGEVKFGNFVKSTNADPVGFGYLLGQAIRQYVIPQTNWHVSKAAADAWMDITGYKYNDPNNGIEKFFYNEKFVCRKSMNIPRFQGNTNDFSRLNFLSIQQGQAYSFNEIFIAEHTTPISDIIKALKEYYANCELKGTKLCKTTIKDILDKIHITRMLKIEDRRILLCSNRISHLQQGSEFNYLQQKSSLAIFNDLYKLCYSGLKAPSTLSNATPMNGMPQWAKALTNQNYTILI